MTKTGVSQHLISIVADLSRDLPDQLRYWRLLDAIMCILPCCDVAVLMALESSSPDRQILKPLAADGLDDKVSQQYFTVEENPRLAAWLQSREPLYFPANTPLPDPYGKLLKPGDRRTSPRDSLGVALYVGGKPWGLLSLNTRQTEILNKIDLAELRSLITFIEAVLSAVLRTEQLRQQMSHTQRISKQLLEQANKGQLLGSSPALQRIKEEIAIIAPSELTILLQGEDGVGRSLVAQNIHQLSNRSKQPFINVDCSSLDDQTAYGTLFGSIGNNDVAAQPGLFQLAHQGTLFINEVAALPLEVQIQLEQLLKTATIQTQGSSEPGTLDVRLLTASRCNLQQAVSRGLFRPELYRLLMVYPMQIPPLRERAEDIALLSSYFLERHRRRLGLSALQLDTDSRQRLKHYTWPGNIRELEQVLSRAAIKAMTDQAGASIICIKVSQLDISPRELPKNIQAELSSLPQQIILKEAVDDYQRALVNERLQLRHGNLAAAARDLGLNRSNFYRLLQRLEIKY